MNVEKCKFDVKEKHYPGLILSISGIRPDHHKVQALLDWPVPRTAKEWHQFHGLGSYYWGYIEGFARIAKPLTELMKKDAMFVWSPECQHAFDGLRSTLTNAVMRHHFDLSLPRRSLRMLPKAAWGQPCIRQYQPTHRNPGPWHSCPKI